MLITLLEESPITFIPEVHMSCIRSLDKEELFRGFFNVLRLRPTLQLYPSRPHQFNPIFSGVRGTRSLVLCGCFVDCSLSSLFFFWSLCCLSFFDVRIMITPLVSSNSSYRQGIGIWRLYLYIYLTL